VSCGGILSLVEALGFPKEQVLGFQLVLPLMADDEKRGDSLGQRVGLSGGLCGSTRRHFFPPGSGCAYLTTAAPPMFAVKRESIIRSDASRPKSVRTVRALEALPCWPNPQRRVKHRRIASLGPSDREALAKANADDSLVSPWSRRAVGICQPDTCQPGICQPDTCRSAPAPAAVAPYAANQRQRQRSAWRRAQPLRL
jgi:hypothetical protein